MLATNANPYLVQLTEDDPSRTFLLAEERQRLHNEPRKCEGKLPIPNIGRRPRRRSGQHESAA